MSIIIALVKTLLNFLCINFSHSYGVMYGIEYNIWIEIRLLSSTLWRRMGEGKRISVKMCVSARKNVKMPIYKLIFSLNFRLKFLF